MRKPKVRAEDVARKAGVSPATVSLVLNGKDAGRVTAATRQRIVAAAQALGYRIDRRARGLATGRSGMIGFVAPDIANPFFGDVHMALLKALGDRYQLLAVATEIGRDAARHNIEQLLAIGVEAVIAVSVDPAFLDGLEPDVPMILVDTARTGPGIVSINYAVEAGAAALAAHLLALGHRRVAYVDGAARARIFTAQRSAFAAAMKRGGARPPVTIRTPVGWEQAAAATRANIAAWREDRITAIVTATDLQAYGVFAALREAGIAAPDAISVASFDDLPLSAGLAPALTSVRVPAAELGVLLARELTLSLADPGRADPRISIPVSLSIRASTAPAPRRPGAHS
jgi:LacI family transcriptional regulator